MEPGSRTANRTMRWTTKAVGLLLAVTAFACTPTATRTPTNIAEAPAAQAPGTTSDEKTTAVRKERTQAPQAAVANFAAEWAWIRGRYPDAALYRPVENEDALLGELLSWAQPQAKTTIYDRACRPIRVERTDDQLYGLYNRQTQVRGSFKDVHTGELLLDQRIVVTDGFSESYRRGRNGRWQLEIAGAMGEAHTVGLLLSNVTSDAAWYNGELVRLRIACTKRLEEESPCTSGGSRKCVRCLEWGIHPSSMEPGYGRARHVPQTTAQATEAIDCTAPCRSDILPQEGRRAQAALRGHPFVVDGLEEHPFLFRTRKACRQYRRAHRIPPDVLRTW